MLGLRFSAGLLAGSVLLASPAGAADKLGPRLARAWGALEPDRLVSVWVDFGDREAETRTSASLRRDLVSERSFRRRLRVLPAGEAVDSSDLPVDPACVEAVAARVTRVRQRSRWLNSLSVEATRAEVEAVAALACVRQIEVMARFRNALEPQRGPLAPGSSPALERRPTASPTAGPAAGREPPPDLPSGPGYGESADQLRLLRVDALHDRGLTGLGVLVAHFDTGYERPTHEVFRTLRVAAGRDFVDHDPDPTDPPQDPGETMEHGQYTLSVLGGFKPGKLVGVAPGATFILARTEMTTVETPSEEDDWIAALEWADSLGADIVSSSLKFLDYDPPFEAQGYTWEQMDGSTARVTRAAATAERHGILIFNGAGNEGYNAYHNTLVAPADGRDVIAVGAVSMAGARAHFSSVGPTTDFPERIKPDVMAPGVGIVAADVVHDSSYTRVDGTSLATPLAAGVAALLLSVHPATPAQVRDALRLTASRAGSPDNQMGWGLIDALAAYQYLIGLFPASGELPSTIALGPRFANPFQPAGTIAFGVPAGGWATLRVYDAFGRCVRELARAGRPGSEQRVVWDGCDTAGRAVPRGVYLVELRASGGPEGPAIKSARKLSLVR